MDDPHSSCHQTLAADGICRRMQPLCLQNWTCAERFSHSMPFGAEGHDLCRVILCCMFLPGMMLGGVAPSSAACAASCMAKNWSGPLRVLPAGAPCTAAPLPSRSERGGLNVEQAAAGVPSHPSPGSDTQAAAGGPRLVGRCVVQEGHREPGESSALRGGRAFRPSPARGSCVAGRLKGLANEPATLPGYPGSGARQAAAWWLGSPSARAPSKGLRIAAASSRLAGAAAARDRLLLAGKGASWPAAAQFDISSGAALPLSRKSCTRVPVSQPSQAVPP